MKLLTKICLASAMLGFAFLPITASAGHGGGGGHHGGKGHHKGHHGGHHSGHHGGGHHHHGAHHGDRGRVNVYIHGGHGYGHRGYYYGNRGYYYGHRGYYYGGHRACGACFVCRSRHYSVKTCNFGTVNYYRAHGYSCYRYGGCRW